MLTKDEVLNNEETFFGSQATDFGEALRNHDEFWSRREWGSQRDQIW